MTNITSGSVISAGGPHSLDGAHALPGSVVASPGGPAPQPALTGAALALPPASRAHRLSAEHGCQGVHQSSRGARAPPTHRNWICS